MKRIVIIVLVIIIIIIIFWRGFGTCNPTPLVSKCDTTITSWKHFLNKDTAQVYITRFKDFKDGKAVFNKTMIAQSFLHDSAKTMMRNMMLRDSCVGMRIYYGLNWSNKIIPITCGVTNNGSDIYWRRPRPTESNARTMELFEDGLLDVSQEEPPIPDPSITAVRMLIRP